MADLSETRLCSIRERGEAIKRWSQDEALSLPDGIRETMKLAAEDITALLDERERLLKKEGDRGRKEKGEND